MRTNRLFGTSGVRGRINQSIDPSFALQVGHVYAQHLKERHGDQTVMVVGYDNRFGAEMLQHAVIAGILSAGVEVFTVGMVSTGMMSVYLTKHKFTGGILITGSHLPPDRIGIIPLLGDGCYCPTSVTDDLEDRLAGNGDHRVKFSEIPKVARPTEGTVVADYLQDVCDKARWQVTSNQGFNVLIDPCNSTGAIVAQDLFFKHLNCGVKVLNARIQPIPDRPSECRASTCTHAIEEMKTGKYDLGLCVDGDADRALFIDANGNVLSEDTVGALFALRILRAGDSCVAPINSSGLIKWVCEKKCAWWRPCAVGQPAIGEAVKEHKARFAYEESGKYFFVCQQLWTDGLFTGAKMLEIMANEHKSLAELVSELPVFHQAKLKLAVPEALKERTFAETMRLMETHLCEEGHTDLTLDGFRRDYTDNSWVLVRGSGTEESIRVMSDAPSLARADALADQAMDLLERAFASAKA